MGDGDVSSSRLYLAQYLSIGQSKAWTLFVVVSTVRYKGVAAAFCKKAQQVTLDPSSMTILHTRLFQVGRQPWLAGVVLHCFTRLVPVDEILV